MLTLCRVVWCIDVRSASNSRRFDRDLVPRLPWDLYRSRSRTYSMTIQLRGLTDLILVVWMAEMAHTGIGY
jgi:hypothetical protein